MLVLLDLANSYRLHALQAETQMDMSAACGAYVVPEAQKTYWHTVSTIWQARQVPNAILVRNMVSNGGKAGKFCAIICHNDALPYPNYDTGMYVYIYI